MIGGWAGRQQGQFAGGAGSGGDALVQGDGDGAGHVMLVRGTVLAGA